MKPGRAREALYRRVHTVYDQLPIRGFANVPGVHANVPGVGKMAENFSDFSPDDDNEVS